MTERVPRARATRRELRAWAWVAGSLALVAPWAAITGSPPPAAAGGERPVTVIRRITRRIIITHPAQPAGVRYVYVTPSGSSSTSSSGSGSSSAPPPATSTGGS